MIDPMNAELPARLLDWRKAKGYTQPEAAAAFGVNIETYKTTELGRYEPRGFGLSFILRVLDAHDKETQCLADVNRTGETTTENETKHTCTSLEKHT